MMTILGNLVGKTKVLGLAGVAAGALALAPKTASAHDRFSLGITIGAPAPVYVAPAQPVYVPAPVYTPAPVYAPAYAPAPVYTPAPVCQPAYSAPIVVTAPVCPPPIVVAQPRYFERRPVFSGGWHHGWDRRR